MQPIFIVGCERSGTTLLGAMLGAHSECLTIPESMFKRDVLRAHGYPKDTASVLAALNRITKHWSFKLWDMKIDPTHNGEAGESYRTLLEYLVPHPANCD